MGAIFTNLFLESFKLLKYDHSIFQDHHIEQKGEECPKYRVLRDFGYLVDFFLHLILSYNIFGIFRTIGITKIFSRSFGHYQDNQENI